MLNSLEQQIIFFLNSTRSNSLAVTFDFYLGIIRKKSFLTGILASSAGAVIMYDCPAVSPEIRGFSYSLSGTGECIEDGA